MKQKQKYNCSCGNTAQKLVRDGALYSGWFMSKVQPTFMMWSYPNVYSVVILLPLEKLGNLFHIWSYFKFKQHQLTHFYTKGLYGSNKTPQFSYQGGVNTATGSFFHIHEFVRNYHRANLNKISSTIRFHCGCIRLYYLGWAIKSDNLITTKYEKSFSYPALCNETA